jgi:hypothetical protein
MATTLIHPAQAMALSLAVHELSREVDDIKEEYVHMTVMYGHDDKLKIELSSCPNKRYISRDGTITENRND